MIRSERYSWPKGVRGMSAEDRKKLNRCLLRYEKEATPSRTIKAAELSYDFKRQLNKNMITGMIDKMRKANGSTRLRDS